MPDYQQFDPVYKEDGTVEWRRNPAWFIGQLITRHASDCMVVADLRRTAMTHTMSSSGRLASAETAACTCGSAERHGINLNVRGICSPNLG